jgi:hypothetical protein
MTDYPGAIPYFVDRSRVFANQNTHSVIVLHGCGSADPNQTAQQLGDYFGVAPDMTSVHYGIDRKGVCCQYVLEQDGAAGNCCLEAGYDPFWNQFNGDNLNVHTISIEHENNIDNSLALTPAQQDASFKLVAYLIKKYGNIPIKTHASIAPINRAHCPGNYPMAALQAYLTGQQQTVQITGLENSGVFTTTSSDFKNYFQLQGTLWHCTKTGFNVGGNVQKFIAELSLDGQQLPLSGLPTSNEIHVAGTQSDVIQHFEHFSVRFAPTLKAFPPSSKYMVYVMSSSDPLLQASTPDVTALKNTITSLQGKINQIAAIAKV